MLKSRMVKQRLKKALLLIAISVAQYAQSQTLELLHSFSGPDGSEPLGRLLEVDGFFYGTTAWGGQFGWGTIFRINPSGEFSLVSSFDGTNGGTPQLGLLLAKDGSFYGTTAFDLVGNKGTIFQMTPGGDLTTVFRFSGTNGAGPGQLNGFTPMGITWGSDGALYGTTRDAGPFDWGTVFKVETNGVFRTMHSFQYPSEFPPKDGFRPSSSLVQASDGNFYGTTWGGGANYNYGIAFRITPSGSFTNLAPFDSKIGQAGSSIPEFELVAGQDGNLYGIATGKNNVIFKMTLSGQITALASFTNRTDVSSLCPMMEATDGNLYITADDRGIYKLPSDQRSKSVKLRPRSCFHGQQT